MARLPNWNSYPQSEPHLPFHKSNRMKKLCAIGYFGFFLYHFIAVIQLSNENVSQDHRHGHAKNKSDRRTQETAKERKETIEVIILIELLIHYICRHLARRGPCNLVPRAFSNFLLRNKSTHKGLGTRLGST